MYCCYTLIDTKDFDIFYVGKSSLDRLNDRKSEHIYSSKNKKNYRSNKIRKLLKEGFNFHIIPIKFYLTEEESYQDETNMINLYKNMGYKLCNTTEGGEGLRNPSVETRKKLAKAASKRFSGLGNPSKMPHVKKLRSEFFKKNNPMLDPIKKEKIIESIKASCAKPVLQFSKTGDFIKEYESIREAARVLETGKEGISRCCHGKLKTSAGFVWKFSNESKKLGG